ncbi:MAG: GIY-YIG catalytic domain protein [Candidatus Wolfebacteria bacterium GW2011_GWC2_39_22]|uniref:GIY-YIG catalytic domain protein n=1 Tax=Candidatus Wolfebacteria bacterium GW2011_GWC2_39_22 TaxID=1619013 RepID=A0A0G0QPG5_9BACT|nr:MAG: GIY-YIG catalytic domain protein [Candidatus Wolfebacteria bacterium GW2011_GWC2_39_22]
MYILKSEKDGELYIGSTGNLKNRIEEHNTGKVFSTKQRAPFKLVYCEGYCAEGEARRREKNLKLRARALRQLLLRIEDSIRL